MHLMLLFILLFSIYAWLWMFDAFCKFLGHLTNHLTIIQMYYDSPRTPICCCACEREEEQKNDVLAQTTVSPWWMPQTIVGI